MSDTPEITYYRVGNVERWSQSRREYVWHEGYSTHPEGLVQPWVTRGEARTEAKPRKAVFRE